MDNNNLFGGHPGGHINFPMPDPSGNKSGDKQDASPLKKSKETFRSIDLPGDVKGINLPGNTNTWPHHKKRDKSLPGSPIELLGEPCMDLPGNTTTRAHHKKRDKSLPKSPEPAQPTSDLTGDSNTDP